MATIAHPGEEHSFSVGKVLSRAFGVMGDNPVVIFGISLALGALPEQLYSYYMERTIANAATTNPLAVIAVTVGSVIVMILLTMVVQAALVRTTMAYEEGERASFGASVGVGLSMALPLIGLTILMIPALLIAALFFLVPAVILLLMWAVAGPALVTERTSIIAAFGRSRYLTKGARWKILGLSFVIWVVLLMIGGVIGALTVVFGGTGTVFGDAPTPLPIRALSVVTSTLTIAFSSTVITSLYISLRNWKDGPQAHSLADIFA